MRDEMDSEGVWEGEEAEEEVFDVEESGAELMEGGEEEVIEVDAQPWGVEVMSADVSAAGAMVAAGGAGGVLSGAGEAEEMAPSPRRVREYHGPWGFWSTIMWVVIGLAGSLMVGFIPCFVYMFVLAAGEVGRGGTPEELQSRLSLPLVFLLFSVGFSALIPWAVFLSWMRGVRPGEYLAIRRFYARDLVWTAVPTVGFVIGLHYLAAEQETSWMEPEMMEQLMGQLLDPVQFLWMAIAVVVLAPVVEEVFFRGFMLTGLASSWAGPVWGVVLRRGIVGGASRAVHVAGDRGDLLRGSVFRVGAVEDGVGAAVHRAAHDLERDRDGGGVVGAAWGGIHHGGPLRAAEGKVGGQERTEGNGRGRSEVQRTDGTRTFGDSGSASVNGSTRRAAVVTMGGWMSRGC